MHATSLLRRLSQMKRMKLLCSTLALCAMAIVPASAQVVHIVAAGSSAQFQGYAVAAVNDLTPLTTDPLTRVHHWSIKTSHSGGCGGACAGIVDNRTAGIPEEFGNLWVVWTVASDNVTVDHLWAYLSVDSVVGVRSFLGGAKLVLGANIGTTVPDNAISSALFNAGAPNNGAAQTCASGDPVATCDDTTLPANVIELLGGSGAGATGHAITAGATDIRPEDAKYATQRALAGPLDTLCGANCRSWSLNYGNGTAAGGNVATKQIISGTGTSTAAATPVQFGLPGFADPITKVTVSNTVITIPLGEAPIVFLANRTNSNGLGLLGHGNGSYWSRNLWDQHPWPPNGVPPAPVTRRPLGNLFTGHDCGIDNAAFDWPGDGGNRLTPPANVGIHLILREPLSGTMNTTEFSEFRRYGTTNGNGPTGNGQPALTSQEQGVDPSVSNPLKQLACVTFGGDRTRAIGTGESINGAGTLAGSVNGVLNTPDALAYAFFGFGNVSKIATKVVSGVLTKQPGFGYLMIDGFDPLFDDYGNAGLGNPGQPAVSTDGTTWGELPGCSEQPGSPLPHCTTTGIWGSNPSFPNVRNGNYPAWSELRLLCDSANAHCLSSSDPLGAQALVWNTQCDIHFNHVGGVPDFLPFNDPTSSGACTWNAPYGDAGVVREHYAFVKATNLTAPTSTHQTTTQIDFHSEACSGGAAPGTPVTGPTPDVECGGDAGGWIVPTGSTAVGILQ
jgi:hypothetical protein